MNKLLITTALTLAVTGCAADGSFESYHERVERQRIEKINQLSEQARMKDSNPNEYAFQQGANHGCNSGYSAGGDITKSYQKDVEQYIKNEYYKTGWNDGYAKCKAVADLAGQAIDNSLRTAPLAIP